MKALRLCTLAISLLVLFVSLTEARSILEKKMFYVSSQNKIGEAGFWVIYLGQYDCTLNRDIPGQGMTAVKANVNLQFLSSGYVEGNGYGSKGKVDCTADIMIKTDKGESKVEFDSIDCIYDGGQKIKLTNGQSGDFILSIEGQEVTSQKFTLSEYKLIDYYGEKILKSSAEPDVFLQAISFTKEGAQRALKAASQQ